MKKKYIYTFKYLGIYLYIVIYTIQMCHLMKLTNIIIQLKELGTPLHGVAAMLPFMAEIGKDDPMERPGFKVATSEFPFITRAQLRSIPE